MKNGQVLIVILLMMAVVLTVGLAISSRTVTELSVSTTQDESAKALSVAESGVEAALEGALSGTGTVTVGSTNATYTISRAAYGQGPLVRIPRALVSGDTATVFLSGHDTDGVFVPGLDKFTGSSIRVCWGSGVSYTQNTAPAVEATYYYQTGGGETRLKRYAVDPNPARLAANGFTAINWVDVGGCPAGSNNPNNDNFAAVLNLAPAVGDVPLFLRLRVLYNGSTPHPVMALAAQNFPSQGDSVSSVGSFGAANQKVEVVLGYPDPPVFFDNAIFSGTSVAK